MSETGKSRGQIFAELKELREANNLQSAVIEGMTDAVFVKDLQGPGVSFRIISKWNLL